jgi:hypothetical protein
MANENAAEGPIEYWVRYDFRFSDGTWEPREFGPRYNEGDAQKDHEAVSNDTSGNVSNVRLLRHEYTVVEPR